MGHFVSYDPYAVPPPPGQIDGLDELRATRAEALTASDVEVLQDGDILFIDSSHTVRAGGDVTHLFGELLPRLAPGVLVHVHDVYLPYPYPRAWVERFHWYWAENDLLRAVPDVQRQVRGLWAAYARQPRRLAAAIPNYRPSVPPISFWMRVRETSR